MTSLSFEPASESVRRQPVFEIRPRQIVRVGTMFMVRGYAERSWLIQEGVAPERIWTRTCISDELGRCTVGQAAQWLAEIQAPEAVTA